MDDQEKNTPIKPAGIECPKCGCRHFYVIKVVPSGNIIRRRRACRHCGMRITTTENVVQK